MAQVVQVVDMSPLKKYERDLKKTGFSYDAAQENAVRHLDSLFHELIVRYEQRPRTLARKITAGRRRGREQAPVTGLYLWGGVGRGKTYLVDLFYDCLPFRRKMRVHFHRFMQRVHRDLRLLQGEKNPLDKVADSLAAEAKVVCFDEFFVSDITDAMILGGLLKKLFARGVTLVATSNIVPGRLYENGLQRARFLPAIELIKKHTEVVNVDGKVDYRLRTLVKAEIYHCPLDEAALHSLTASFESLAPEPGCRNSQIEIEGRMIDAVMVADDVLWCDFKALCDGPRSQNDYIELARLYHAVLIANVPVMDAAAEDMARRFINLIDEFYDRNVKVIISAEVEIHLLYSGERLTFEFERTKSRLLEMQSHEYLGREHRP